MRKLALAKRNALPEEERASKSHTICENLYKFFLKKLRASSTNGQVECHIKRSDTDPNQQAENYKDNEDAFPKFFSKEFRASSTTGQVECRIKRSDTDPNQKVEFKGLNISLYEAINSEVNLSELALALTNSGASVLKPIMLKEEGVMEFTNWENAFDPLERISWQPSLLVNFGQFALRSSFDSGSRNTSALTFAQSLLARIASKFPSQKHFYKPYDFELVKPEKIDVIICPVVAFDNQCMRLGYGGGYYDRYLPRLTPSTLKIGVAFSCQKVDKISPDPHDVPLDIIITENHTYHH